MKMEFLEMFLSPPVFSIQDSSPILMKLKVSIKLINNYFFIVYKVFQNKLNIHMCIK